MGSNAIAEKICSPNPAVMLYAPPRTLIYIDSGDRAWFAAGQPSMVLASFTGPAIAEIGVGLDRHLAETARGPWRRSGLVGVRTYMYPLPALGELAASAADGAPVPHGGEDLAGHERRGRPRETMAPSCVPEQAVPAVRRILAMGEREQAPNNGSGNNLGHGPEGLDEASEAAMMREILRRQERHREGGVEPGLGETGEEPGPEA